MRSTHRAFPTVPLLVVAKEISLEDVRLGLEKMPDRFYEHPATVLVITNLNYAEAPRLMPRDVQSAASLIWQEVRLAGNSAHEYAEQIEELEPTLNYGWQTKLELEVRQSHSNVRSSVLVIYREDHKFLLDPVIPKPGRIFERYDFVLASQPWRARMSAEFKAQKVMAPLARSLASGGRLLAVQSYGRKRPGAGNHPKAVARAKILFRSIVTPLLAALKSELGRDVRDFTLARRCPTRRLCFATTCTRCLRRLATALAPLLCTPHGMPRIYVNQVEDDEASRTFGRAERRLSRCHPGGPSEIQRAVVQRRNLRRDEAKTLMYAGVATVNGRRQKPRFLPPQVQRRGLKKAIRMRAFFQ